MRLSNKLLGASNMMYAIWKGSQRLPNDEDMGRRHAHTIDGPNPVILVRTHTQLDHDIARLCDLQDSDIGGIVGVDLQHSVNTSRLYARIATVRFRRTDLIMYMRPMRRKKCLSTFLMIRFSSPASKVARNRDLASGSSRNMSASALDTVAPVRVLLEAAASCLVPT